ncbi:MAG TPA: hypothetical protein PLV68_15575, partial [Ilumatobacteraceae bacterium]|nr:hypothetical protein [Ilumatobacteraceae bacterium]
MSEVSDEATNSAAPTSARSQTPDRPPKPFRPVRKALNLFAFAAIIWFFVLPLIPGFRKAADELSKVNPALLAVGLGLEVAALFAYSLMTRAA